MSTIVTNNTDISVAKIGETTTRKPRGFAAMSPEKVKEISSKGGKAAHALGKAHQFTPDEARAAGQKGGVAPHKTRGKTKTASEIVNQDTKAA